ncbi:MAG: DUF1549 domain-containing protein [Verrucomicrobiales bacterium]|nr:DUF1549 domain-containing protein [Verrucomicrobiales bacterium]
MKRGLLSLCAGVLTVAASAATGGDKPVGGTGHWAFQPVRDPAPPVVRNAAWCRTPLDRFVAARWEAEGVQPEAPADRRTLIRRASFDLTGLPPRVEEVDAFLAERTESAWPDLIDRLLQSPRYGEHWGRHWLDVVRYADTAGETADYPVPVAWRYRNYVIDAFNADKPYDEFLREQIAGDILAGTGPAERYAERVTATGYLAISRRFGFDSENYHHLTIQDTIDTVGQSVLGLTLGCARCHAHKYDPVSMPEYYALYGIFDSTRYAFPGSEQKQKHRALSPLLPPAESKPRWREYERRVASLVRLLDRHGVSAPAGVLRSLDEMDGDFEMQAPAAGGSKGVLVPPWVFQGPIAVTLEAQSPFRNLHPLGKVGASLAAGTEPYRVGQALHPAHARGQEGRVHVNLDFRLGPDSAATAAQGRHRFWIGAEPAVAAVELLLGPSQVVVRTGDREDVVRTVEPGRWYNLQLHLDLAAGTVAGVVGTPGDLTRFEARPWSSRGPAVLDFVAVDSADPVGTPLPAIAWDNLGVDDFEIPPVSTTPTSAGAVDDGPDPVALRERLVTLTGTDGDFELQEDGEAPVSPWGPGPKSVVKVSAAAQSAYTNVYPAGRLGIRLPGGGAYNGFGQTLTKRWQRGKDATLHASLDLRVAEGAEGANGSWRFYLGHGPGGSAAVELFVNGRELFRRSGDVRESVGVVRPGAWHQVQLELDLEARRYQGRLRDATSTTEFTGEFATGWDGSVDYTFIDSYGHLPGDRPTLDADNLALGTQPPWVETDSQRAALLAHGDGWAARRAEVLEVRRQLAEGRERAQRLRRELEMLLADGPFPLAYAVSEGNPRDSRIQLRGEPEKPGDPVPRGFLQVLGGGAVPSGVRGSGRLELAEWLTHPRNPLTARVMVNRIWQYHFGQALVRTPNDFGTRGQAPWDADLLDHLATEFMRGGWSIKAMHRLIMTSAVYQQRSRLSLPARAEPAAPAGDDCPVVPAWEPSRARAAQGTEIPGGFTPFARRRLGAEETRDAILEVSGELDATPGQGHPFPEPTTWGYTQHGPFSAVYDHAKRSVYLMTQRIKRHPFLALFDGPDPNASTAERRTSIVPTQALYFLNDPFVHRQSERFAQRVLETPGDDAARTESAYRRALGRRPNEAECAEAKAFLDQYRAELGASNTVPGSDREVAAYAALARVLLGSNEFLTVD